MKYKDEKGNVIENPDFTKGEIIRTEQVVIGHHDETPTVTHEEVMKGTEAMNDGKGLKHTVVDVPAIPEGDDYEEYGIYHVWTDEEAAEKNAGKMILQNKSDVQYVAMMAGVDL